MAHPDVQYAAIAHADGLTPCTAQALGGTIDVVCETTAPGVLVVREHAWSGWQVQVDGTPGQLTANPWLALESAAGRHHYHFRYRPWDVPVGALLSLIGLVLAWWYGTSASPAARQLVAPAAHAVDSSNAAAMHG